jgi:putative polyhydroxyalkanoate system protein
VTQIVVRRPHSLPRAQARAVANAVAKELARDYGLKATWQGDTLHFERASLTGRLQLKPKEILLEIALGFLLAAFKDNIARIVEQKVARVLADVEQPKARAARRRTPRPKRSSS